MSNTRISRPIFLPRKHASQEPRSFTRTMTATGNRTSSFRDRFRIFWNTSSSAPVMSNQASASPTWSCEQHMDELAGRLGMDALDFRLKNVFVDGDLSYWGERLVAVGLKETLLKATEAIGWGKKSDASNQPKGIRMGKGFACIAKPTRTPTTSTAAVQI